ncbi:prenyltransferase/squalene oxidase repeat-containing protein, partial [Nocardioides alcanivorans]
MKTMHVRRAIGLAGAGVLAAGLTVALPMGAAQAEPDPQPAATGATWLATQPVDGLINVKNEYDGEVFEGVDQGLSLDVAFALNAVGGQGDTVTEILDAVAGEVEAGKYIQGDEYDWQEPYDFQQVGYYSGATAKTLTAAVELGGDPTSFGGVDLVDRLEELVTPSGRIEDDSFFGDYANVIGQSFAVRGLQGAGDDASAAVADAVTEFLVLQQCDNGGFRLNFNGADAGCTDDADADPDATSNALVALSSIETPDAEVEAALADGTDYLLDIQKADGSFGGGTSTEESNSNSTGLAGSALAALGETEAATDAAAWVRAHQLTGLTTCEAGIGADAGAIAYNDADAAAAAKDGIGDLERGVFVRAAAQALPVLTLTPAAVGDLAVKGKAGFIQAGSATKVTVTGLAAGERACLTGGKAAVVVTGSGSATVTAKAGTGVRTLTLVTAGDATAQTTVS